MRLQVHTTDARYLEPRLGTVQSKGCIRIPATLNKLLDHYGILDAGYQRAMAIVPGCCPRTANRLPGRDAT